MLPPISSVPGLSTEERASILDTLFEPCTQLHTLSVSTLHETTFADYASLISAIEAQLLDLLNSSSTSDSEWLDAILSAHPRLGEKKVDREQSRREQAQLHAGVAEPMAENLKLKELNQEYEEAFPGLRYVYVCSLSVSGLYSVLHYSSTSLPRSGLCSPVQFENPSR